MCVPFTEGGTGSAYGRRREEKRRQPGQSERKVGRRPASLFKEPTGAIGGYRGTGTKTPVVSTVSHSLSNAGVARDHGVPGGGRSFRGDTTLKPMARA